MIYAQHKIFFETFGFLVLRQVFPVEKMDEITHEFELVMNADREGRPFPGGKRQAVYGGVEQSELLRQLLEHDDIYEMAELLLGPGFIWQGSDVNMFVGDTSWHSGREYGNILRGIKMAIYLDAVTGDTGALRVVPGSHMEPLHGSLEPLRKDDGVSPAFDTVPEQVPSFPIESEPGDVVVFTESLWHASFGGSDGRRMFTLNFLAQPTNSEQIDLVRSMYEGDLEFMKEEQYTKRDWIYGEDFLSSDRPRIKNMVAILRDLGLR